MLKIRLQNPHELRKLMLKKGFSQRKLARTAGISNPYLNQIIQEDRNPSAVVAKKIVDTLQVEFDDIFFIDDAYQSEHSIEERS